MRLFVAILFGEEIKNALEAYQRELGAWGRASFSRRENLHLTLAFIGERDDPDKIAAALGTVEHSAFGIGLAGGLRFGDVRCVGVEDGGESVRLADKVRRALDEAGVPYDRKPMKPHITVARRFRSFSPEAEEMLRRLRPEPAREMACAFCLMRSEQKKGALVYTPLAAFRLG